MTEVLNYVFFFKQKTAYEMRISDWSSDVCSSDLALDSPVISQLRAQRARVSAEAAALSQRYGPGHPDLQRAQEQLRDLDKEINGEEIGRASCRERVCQYV